ncbi:MAG: type II toxin-antitoxin system HicB family antitoxin [Candidatus Aminicenantales bacterium]
MPRCNIEHRGPPMKYKVVLQESDEGFSVSVPGLPGCWSQGQTEAEALDNVRDAIKEYLSVVSELTAGATVREVEVTV